MKKNERLIVALDVDTLQQATTITHKLDGLVNFYKIGWRLFMAEGMHAVHVMSSLGYNVFLDLKLNDIPNTIKCALHNLPYIKNVKFFTLFGNANTIKAAKEGILSVDYGPAKNNNIKLLQVSVLSSNEGAENKLPALYEIKAMIDNGLNGVIMSGPEVEWYRNSFSHNELTIVTPGVRLSEDNNNEHTRVNTVKCAFNQGADYIVVGRPIIESTDIIEAAKKYIKEIPN